ncbi:hypothetical protein K435DRAFT_658864 [Dendrothele bispora CBS 962.96]|uniref:Retrotransposon gag domain-containing protein n=1 Tax=Dendrothele bispora (strain CBS 962.96) TaxID=1314807 RepID=A0A4S8MBX4_DENBC|nr:hypothetical protein K435DRAFT_658864 [Dendrothele bispora CBS 962.96]
METDLKHLSLDRNVCSTSWQTYNTAKKNIAFMLSFMKKGTAVEWKLIKVYNYMKDGWPTNFNTFRKEWEETFLPVDFASDARMKLQIL